MVVTTPPAIIEPAPALMIYGDVVQIELKTEIVYCHVMTRHTVDGTEELHRQAIVVLTPHAFLEALDAANQVARQGGARRSRNAASARRRH